MMADRWTTETDTTNGPTSSTNQQPNSPSDGPRAMPDSKQNRKSENRTKTVKIFKRQTKVTILTGSVGQGTRQTRQREEESKKQTFFQKINKCTKSKQEMQNKKYPHLRTEARDKKQKPCLYNSLSLSLRRGAKSLTRQTHANARKCTHPYTSTTLTR